MEAKMNMGQQKPDLFKLSKFMNIADEAVMTEAETCNEDAYYSV